MRDEEMNTQDQPRRSTRNLLLFPLFVLALLMGLCCFTLLFSQLVLSEEKQEWLEASMATKLRADYRPDEGEVHRFAPLQPEVIEETAKDESALAAVSGIGLVPVAVAVASSGGLPLLSPSPTPLPVPTPELSPTPQPSPTLQPTVEPTEEPTVEPTEEPTAEPTEEPTAEPPPPPPPPPLQVLAVNPTQSDNDTAINITITGTNFLPNPTAFLVDGGATALATTYISPNTLNAVIPVWFTADYYDLTVTNPDAQSDTLTNAFTLTNPIPLISGVTPDNGVDNANTNVTINGNHFVNGLSAWMGGFSLTVTFVNSATLNTSIPGAIMPGGPYTLTISNPGPLTPTNNSTDAFTVTLSSTYGDPPTCITATNCISASGTPDGNSANIFEGGYLTFTLPVGSGIRDGSGYDFVFFEAPLDPGIQLDWVVVDISDDGVTWHEVLNWGDNITDTNTNLAPYNYNGDTGEEDNETIPSAGLWPSGLPLNTGIAIDINTPTWDPPQGSQYRYIRFSCPSGGGDGSQIDAIKRLH